MKKTLLFIAVGILLLGIVAFAVTNYRTSSTVSSQEEMVRFASGAKNATYIIDGVPFTLVDGKVETPQPNSVSNIITEYFGNEVEYDFNQDGRMDIAFLITQSTGGSGTFFYLVAALNLPTGYQGSGGVLLGDRIAPQSTRITKEKDMVGVIEVNFAERAPGEDFSVEPAVGKTLMFKLDPNSLQFGSVEVSFEGEADLQVMKLTDKTWQWVRTNYTDGRVFAPKKAEAFSLTFGTDGNVSGTTDCNGVSGPYTAVADSLVFGTMATTMMYCDGSEEGVFNELLGQVSTYRFTGKGELELGLKAGTGTMILR